jgi:hypothetical protein
MNNWTNEELQEALAAVARRTAIDPAFRALALQDGATAISRVTQKPLPNNITFRFVDNSGTLKTIPLPDPIPQPTDELEEDALEKVSGGTDGPPPAPPVSGGWSKIGPRLR